MQIYAVEVYKLLLCAASLEQNMMCILVWTALSVGISEDECG